MAAALVCAALGTLLVYVCWCNLGLQKQIAALTKKAGAAAAEGTDATDHPYRDGAPKRNEQPAAKSDAHPKPTATVRFSKSKTRRERTGWFGVDCPFCELYQEVRRLDACHQGCEADLRPHIHFACCPDNSKGERYGCGGNWLMLLPEIPEELRAPPVQ